MADHSPLRTSRVPVEVLASKAHRPWRSSGEERPRSNHVLTRAMTTCTNRGLSGWPWTPEE